MKKLLMTFIILLVSSITYATELTLGYSKLNESEMMNAKAVIPFEYEQFNITTKQIYRYSKLGKLYNCSINIDKDLNERWDIFADLQYMEDEILNINQRLDCLVGIGYKFNPDWNNSHKFSYALVFRTTGINNSFRYRYEYDSYFIGAKAVLYWIWPEYEARGNIAAELKLFKYLSLCVEHAYANKQELSTYFTSAGVKLKL
jgi:hypothetical protein